MKQLKLYVLFLLCWLSSVAFGQISPQSNAQRFVVEAGTYAGDFTYTHTQDTRLTTDAYRPDDWEWSDSPSDVFYRFTLERSMTVLFTADPNNTYILEEERNTGLLIPVQLIDIGQENLFCGELHAGTYYVISESSVGVDGSFTNGEIETVITGSPISMSAVENLGLLSGNKSLTVSGDSRYSLNEYGGSYNDLTYIFELDHYMDLSVTLANTGLSSVNMYLLDDKKQLITSSQNSKLDVMTLPPGIYHLVAEGIRENGVISMNIELKSVDIPDTKVVIDVGNYSDLFQFSHEQDTRLLPDAYRPADWPWENSPSEVFYRFTLETPMLVLVELTSSIGTGTVYCLEEDPSTGQMISIPLMDGSFFNTPMKTAFLKCGTYYIVSEGPADNNGVAIDDIMTTIIACFPSRYEVPLGTFSTNAQQTLTGDTRRTSSEHGDSSRNDIYYSFDLKRPMKLTVSLNSSSDLSSINLYLLDKSNKEIASSTSGSLSVEKLLWGNHYLMVEGQDLDGMFSVDFELEPQEKSIDLGKVSGTKTFSETFNTTDTENRFGLSTNEIFYKLQLTRRLDVFISNRPSTNSTNVNYATAIYLLDADENIIQSTQDGRTGLSVGSLPVGTYYIVSEGKTQNMSIDTQISTTYYEVKPDMGNHNYIMTRTYTQADGSDSRVNINYFDGLGRSFTSVLMGASPSGKDIVTRQDYDGVGRSSREWLPRVSEYSNGKYLTPKAFEGLSSEIYNNDTHPYSMPVYESSSLNRVVAQYSPGQAWIGKAVETEYLLNGTSAPLNCHRYSVNGSILSVNGDYDAGQLYVTKMKDEDGHLSYQFTNKQNQVILTRQQDGDTTHDTYYVYDDFNNLRFVLQPMYQTSPDLALYAFQYKYDDRNLCIEKRLPGDNLITYVYDNADRQVFSQDSKQRASGKWTFYLYDKLNRLTVQGECGNTNITSASRAVITCTLSKNSAGVVASGLGNSGYSSTFSLSLPIIHTVNYYDDYAFRTLPGFNGSNFSDGSYVKGLLTGSMTTILDKETQLYAANYYDNKGRVTRTVQSNQLGGYETTTITYTFTGQPLNVKHVHTASGKTTQTEEYDYTYDHAERLTEVEHTLNGSKVTLNATTYDFLGRPESRTPHGIAANKLTYRYNIRGWLTEISSNPFTQTLHYTDGLETPCYNGNISSMTWKAGNETTERGYKFTYDGLSRMKNATYGEGASLTTNSNRFSEQVLEYDKTGNILGLLRYGQTSDTGYGLVDNLNLTYTGNQLKKVTDAVTDSACNGGFEFKDSADQATEYEYDKNGNLTKDLNKKIADIQYNILNLPNQVTFEDGSSIEYVYDANGTKLRTVHTINGVTQTTDYCGTVIYENGVAKTLLTEAGYVSLNDNKYHYFIQDHQGNNRVVTDQNGTVEETNHYYPFGGVFANNISIQPYKYNGKELDRKNGLEWYDYGARHYDAAIGRWHAVDPMGEKHIGVSPYAYCVNNPVRFIDPDGRDPGEPFKSIQAAAKDWGYYYNGASILRGKEFASTIYKTIINGKTVYTYSEANIGKSDNVMRSQAPNGEAPEAIIHSHGKYQQGYTNNDFSNGDKWNSYNLKVDGYVATPDGSLKKYNTNTAKTTIVSTDLPSDHRDPDRKNKKEPTDVPAQKKREQIIVKEEKEAKLKVPESQRDNYHWVF